MEWPAKRPNFGRNRNLTDSMSLPSKYVLTSGLFFCLKYKNRNYSYERRAQLKLHTTCRRNCLLRIWVLIRMTALVEHSKTQLTERTKLDSNAKTEDFKAK